MIRDAGPSDAKAICGIYNHYIRTGWITFEEEAVPEEEMEVRIRQVQESYFWMVCEEDGRVLGFIYADMWKKRSAYRHTAETTIYLAEGIGRKGIGTRLYCRMLPRLKEMGIRSVIVCIAIPNDASIGLHEKLGFRKVGIFHKAGFKFDTWIDVGYWEKLI